jgi:hypothetical protein
LRRFVSAAVAAFLLAGWPLLQPALPATQERVLRFSDGLDVETLNPLFATDVTLLGPLAMAYFTRFDAQDHLVPELITEIPTLSNGGIGRDGLTITYRPFDDMLGVDIAK